MLFKVSFVYLVKLHGEETPENPVGHALIPPKIALSETIDI